MSDGYQGWLATRPECVQKLAAEFPLGTVVQHDGTNLYLLGYTEDDTLIMSEIDPGVDYDGANASKVYFCAGHLRDAASSGSTTKEK